MEQALCKFDDNWTSSAPLSSTSSSSSQSLSSQSLSSYYNVTQLPLATTSHTPKEIQQFIKLWRDHYICSDVSLQNDTCMSMSVWKQLSWVFGHFCTGQCAIQFWSCCAPQPCAILSGFNPRVYYEIHTHWRILASFGIFFGTTRFGPGRSPDHVRQKIPPSFETALYLVVTKTLGFGRGQELCTHYRPLFSSSFYLNLCYDITTLKVALCGLYNIHTTHLFLN